MSDQDTYLQGKVHFLATQLSQAIDALCDAKGTVAVLTAKLAELEAKSKDESAPNLS